MPKKILFVMSRPPYAGIYVRETLDIVMTTAAFDQEVGLLFVDDGIYQIMRGQQFSVTTEKEITPIFQALEIYEIKDFYAESESLAERGLRVEELLLPVDLVVRTDLEPLLQRYHVIHSN